ncbi:MAG: MarR family transcriptional regulator, partial [Fibrobacterota bacterium]
NEALELMFHGYRSLTARPDRILDARGLQRVHHRILYFVGRNPGISVGDLLETLHVTKQALNAPLRQLQEMRLVDSIPSAKDRRARLLRLTADGIRLERQLTGSQRKQLASVFAHAGDASEDGWRRVMQALLDAPV